MRTAETGTRTAGTWLRVTDVAGLLGISANTVRRWTDAGRIAAHRSPGGHRRYLASDIEALRDGDRGGLRPGDVAELRRQADDHDAVITAGLDLTRVLLEKPRELPFEIARRLCELTGAPRCDIFASQGGTLSPLVAVERGQLDPASANWMSLAEGMRRGDQNGGTLPASFTADDTRLSRGCREALRRRGCRSLAWAPMLVDGKVAGSVELLDSRVRDLSPHLELLRTFANLCAHVIQVEATHRRLDHREHDMRELIDTSHSVAKTHNVKEFVRGLGERLMTTTHADEVNIWRVKDDLVHCLLSLGRDGFHGAAYEKSLELADYPSLDIVMTRHEPLIVNNLDCDLLTEAEIAKYRSWGYASSISMPLVAGDTLVGIVDLYDEDERDWEAGLELLTGMLQPMASLFENALLLRELEEHSRQQHELVDLSSHLARVGGMDAVAQEAAERLRAVAACEDCDIWWREEGYLRCLVSVDSRGVDENVRGHTLRLNRSGTATEVLKTREVLVLSTPSDPRVSDDEREDWAVYGYESLVTLPLVTGDEVVGMIDLFDTRERDFREMQGFLEGAAATVADALLSASLMSSLKQSNAALGELMQLRDLVDEAANLDDLAHVVVARLRTMLQAECCEFWRIENDRMSCLASVDGRGWDETQEKITVELADYGRTAAALAADEPIVVGDLDASDLDPAELTDYQAWGFRSMVTLPLVAGGTPLGLVDVFDVKERDYTKQLDFIRNVGRLLAGALEKALLVDRLERGNRELNINLARNALLSETALALARSLDLNETLKTAAARLCDSVHMPACDIYLMESADSARCAMSLVAGRVDADRIGFTITTETSLDLREAIERRHPPTGRRDDSRPDTDRIEPADQIDKGMWVSLPLMAGDTVLGLVSLVDPDQRRTLSNEAVETAAAICHVVAVAIENARLFASEQVANQESILLNEIAQRTAASLDLEEVVAAAVDQLGDLVTIDDHCLMLISGDTVDRVVSTSTRFESLMGVTTDDVPSGLVPTLLREQVMVFDLPEEGLLTPGHWPMTGLESEVLIALPSDTGLLGILLLASEHRDAFTGVNTRLLRRVGAQLSLAIKNARLYEEIKAMHLGNLKALSSALNAKDYYTLGHAARVTAYSVMLGRQLGWDEELLASLEEVAYLHDIGKISISDRVLLKAGRLNEQEWEQMRQHPVFSAEIIQPLFPSPLVAAVRHHHERYDGGGYPDGLAGNQIPELARAMAVVDAYDAMSCRRPYKAALTYDECLAELRNCRGTQFEPRMVEAFIDVLEDVERRRRTAVAIAAEAAARVPGDLHARLRGREDEDSEEYHVIADILRAVRDQNPPTRFLTTHLRIDAKYVIGVDPEEDERFRSHFGDEIFADEELASMLDEEHREVNTLYADEFGVWVTGLAPLYDSAGKTVAVISADIPAIQSADCDTPRGGGHTFAAFLQSAATRLGRAEIDAITDALTGLYNHRYLQERLDEELARTRELERPLSVLFCDIDNFKAYNDSHGHRAGDRALREIAHMIEQSVRNIDVTARYGGEEFVVLLVETSGSDAAMVAERIQQRIREGSPDDAASLTLSVGIATYPDGASTREDLLEKADGAMYRAKRAGRDRVVIWADAAS